MKKSTYLLTLLLTALLCLPWGSSAWADKLTVYDDDDKSEYVPFYGYNCDNYVHDQIIYPASELTEMVGKNITSMTFYIATAASKDWSVKVNVYLKYTTNTEYSSSGASFISITDATCVCLNKAISAYSPATTMTIEFDDAYTYTGGNLLVDIQSVNKGNWAKAEFYGHSTIFDATTVRGSAYNYSSSSVPSTGSGCAFYPKTTFTYEAAAPVTCPKPSDLNNTELSASSATFTWTAGGSETEWQYICLPAATTVDWEGADVKTATSPTATVDELEPTTDYNFYVRANCGSTDGVSKEISAAFTTPCGAISSLPWEYGFEDVSYSWGTYLIPNCWDKIASGDYPYIYGYEANTGSNCLYFSGGISSSSQYIILPEFAEDLKNLTLSFYYKNYYSSTDYAQFTVGYFTTSGDASSFVALTNSNNPLERKNSYTEAEFDLKDVPTTAKNIVIMYAGGSYSTSAYIDDVRVIRTPSCTKPTELTCTATEANSATLSWTNGGSEEAWKIRYKADGDADWTIASANANPFTLSGLSANTNYTAQILADCGGGELSDWNSTAATFKTACGAIASTSLPWSYGFEDVTPGSGEYIIPDCWTRMPDDDNTYVRANTNYNTSARTGGTKCLTLYGGTTGSYGARTIILPEFEENIANLTVEFYYKTTSTGTNYGKPTVGYINTDGTFVGLKTFDQSGSSAYAFADFAFPASFEDTPANIAIQYAGGTYTYGGGSLYIDDITVKKTPDCVKPTNLACNATTANTATLSWTKGRNETAWKVQYSTSATFASDNHEVNAATNSAFELPGLTANTLYYVHVQAACESDYSDAISFRTDCEVNVIDALNTSWSEDFEGQANDVVPTCWSNDGSTVTPSGYSAPAVAAWGTYTYSSNKMIRMANYYAGPSGTHIAQINTPSVTLPSSPAYELKFDYSHIATCGSFKVQISADGGASFSDLQSYSATIESPSSTDNGATPGEFIEATLDLATYAGNTIILRFLANANYGGGAIFIDNLEIRKAPTCFKPTLADATSITPEGATFTWTASGKGETQYQYICVPTGGTPDWDAVTPTSERTATVSGKAAGTYDFYVRSYCDTNDQSEAVKKSFTTETVPAPASVTVDGITNNSATASWTAPAVAYPVQYQWKTSQAGSEWSAPTTELSVGLSGLDAHTSYTVYVRTYYSETLQSAEASQTFTTLCDPTTVDATHPFVENFNGLTTAGEIPSCWDNNEVVLVPYATTPNATRKWSYFATGHEGKCVRYNSENVSNGVINVLATPQIILNADADLTFWAKNPNGGDYKVQISVNDGAREDLITGLTGLTDWTKQEAPLTYSAGTKIQLFFVGTSNYGNSSSYLYLDDVQINPISCRKPADNPVVAEKDETHVRITWTTGGSNTHYQFSLVPQNEEPVWEVGNVITELEKTFNGLPATTSYDFYVRTYCDEENQSEARKVSFRTACGVYSLPFEENFNTVASYTIPECWDNTEGSLTQDYQRWRTDGSSIRFNSSTNDNGATNVLATPQIQLGNETYLLTFKAKNPTGGDFKVQIEGEGIAREDLLTDLTGIADWTLKYAEIPAKFADKKVRFFFCGTSNDGDANAYISVDDIRVARGEIFEDAEETAHETRLSGLNGQTIDFILTRPMQFNGYYNTLCLPFSLSAEQISGVNSPLRNCTVKRFDYANIAADTLMVAIAGAGSIDAGVPYFVRYDGSAETDRTAHLFRDVTISATAPGAIEDNGVAYRGVFNKVHFEAGTESNSHNLIYLGAANTLYWPGVDMYVFGFRAYLYVENPSPLKIRPGMPVRIKESTQVATGLDSAQGDNVRSSKVLENGHVVIIRNGVKYSVTGQKIQ